MTIIGIIQGMNTMINLEVNNKQSESYCLLIMSVWNTMVKQVYGYENNVLISFARPCIICK